MEEGDWAHVVSSTAFATQHLHRELGAAWSAVLREACCDARGSVSRLRMPLEQTLCSVSMLRWSVKSGHRLCGRTVSAAAEHGSLDVLKYLHENGCPWDEDTCYLAACAGNLDVLKYARENGCPWDARTCSGAAEGGHLDVLEYAHAQGCPWDEPTSREAAAAGHLDVLKYAQKRGCPCDERACFEAAEGGHLDALKYLRRQGCPWNERACLAAAEDPAVVAYLSEGRGRRTRRHR